MRPKELYLKRPKSDYFLAIISNGYFSVAFEEEKFNFIELPFIVVHKFDQYNSVILFTAHFATFKMISLPKLAHLRLKSITIRKKKGEPEENPVEKLLKPVKNLEPEHSDDSDFSEISDVFEEFHKNSYLKRQSNRYLTKQEADIMTMNDFTDNFKKTMANLRENSDDLGELFLETPQEIENIFKNPKDPKIFVKFSPKEKTTETPTDIPSFHELKQLRKPSDTSSSSITWHLLAANSDPKNFKITPPGFDIFAQPHWLQREPVSWTEIEKATLKCESWLREQCP